MPDTFVPPKSPSVSGYGNETEAGVRAARFEPPYSQRSPMGVQNLSTDVKLTFRNLSSADRDAIVSFFETRKGVEAFSYQVPGDAAAKLWTCARWGKAPEKNKLDWRVTCSFEYQGDLT